MQDFRICAKGLLGTLKPIRWKILVSVVIGIVLVALSLVFVWISKRVIDCATGASCYPMHRAVVTMIAVIVLQIVFRVAQNYWEGYVTVREQNRLRRDVYAKVLRSTWHGRERFHSGDTVNRLEEDIATVVSFLCSSLPGCLITVIQFIASCIFLFNLSSRLAWILVFIMPVAVVGSRLFFRKMRALTNEIRALDSRIQGHMQETLQHRILVRTIGATSWAMERMGLLQRDVYGKTMTRLNYGAVSRAFMQIGFASGYAMAFLWGAYGIKNGTVTYGLMVAFLQMVSQVQRPVAEFTRQIPLFIKALSSEDRLIELEGQPQEIENGAIRLGDTPGVRLENVCYSYPGSSKRVIKNISFDFKPGTMTAIVGPTGAGKSSLLRLILALLEPVSGRVTVYGDGREAVSSPDTRVNFMYVPQGNSLMSGTIRDNLKLANPDATEEQMVQALHLAAADFVFNSEQGLDRLCAEVGGGLSEGQAQRIAVARALLHPGGILVLDEATSALDADTELALLQGISDYCRGRKTVICVTHRPAATSFADSVLHID